MEVYDDKNSSYLANRRFLSDFISSGEDGSNTNIGSIYVRKLNYLVAHDETRLTINLNDIRDYDAAVANDFLKRPIHYFAPWCAAIKEYAKTIKKQPSFGDGVNINGLTNKNSILDPIYTIGIDGSFGANRLTPRQLNSSHLGQLVCVEGIATRCSIVRPKVMKTIHFCEKTNAHSEMTYHDATSLTGFPTLSSYPTKDIDGNSLTTEFGLSVYSDHQTLVIQEMPERAPAGLLPSSVDVVLDDDLVDCCKPGDRVAMIGIYRAIASKSSGSTSGMFKAVLIVNNVKHLGKNIGNLSSISEKDIVNIRKLSKRTDLFELMSRSLAPSIYGHHIIKQALVLLLLSGVEKNLDNGTHIRGDINILLVGDPSTAKSQLLRFILNIAPLAINTTGRGSSGVGLTAAVTTDKETQERRLEAGAMVLADRGVVCIDEFDVTNSKQTNQSSCTFFVFLFFPSLLFSSHLF